MKKTKVVVLVLSMVLVFGSVIGSSYAWLMDYTLPLKNTFTAGDVNIVLAETTGNEYKMVPGETIDKDPTVTVEANSEACWLFIKIDEGADNDSYIEYYVDELVWEQLIDDENNPVAGVYYVSVGASNADQTYGVITDDEVTVLDTVDKEALEAITAETAEVSLTFTAYAIQSAGIETAIGAWSEIQDILNS